MQQGCAQRVFRLHDSRSLDFGDVPGDLVARDVLLRDQVGSWCIGVRRAIAVVLRPEHFNFESLLRYQRACVKRLLRW
jgi:hypothetical protein